MAQLPPLNLVMPADARSARDFVAAHHERGSDELFGIGQLCEELGISPRAIRFYEDKGLLAPRRINGTRVYTRRDRARLLLILRAKAIGSSLAEIKQYLDLYGDHGEGRVQQLAFVAAKTDAAIAELEERKTHIEATLAELRVINATVKQHLKAKGKALTVGGER
jgi:DNA-binding transcriptional MerR regulator